MIIDCDTCAIRGVGCGDCVISVLLDAPPTVELAEPELRAIGALADAGLIPRLRLVPVERTRDTPDGSRQSAERSELDDGRTHRQVS